MTIAYTLGIFERALEPFNDALETYHRTKSRELSKAGSRDRN
jgi:hypothetical protein